MVFVIYTCPFREPGREDKEDLNSGSESALAEGFTRVCIMPNNEPPVDSPEVIRYLIERSDSALFTSTRSVL